MIKLRLDLLDAFLRPGSTELKSYFGAGQMVLVDLTDPFLDGKLDQSQSMANGLLTSRQALLQLSCSTSLWAHSCSGRRERESSSVGLVP